MYSFGHLSNHFGSFSDCGNFGGISRVRTLSSVGHLLSVLNDSPFRIEAFEEVFETRADATSSKVDDMIAPLFSESLRLFVCLIWILQTLAMLGVDTIAATASLSSCSVDW